MQVLAFCLLLVGFTACEEIGPNINLGGDGRTAELVDTTYVAETVADAEEKRILMLDFTGVKCLNCPLGADKIKDLVAQYGTRVVPMALFSEFLCAPYPNDPDLRNETAQQIQDMLAPFMGKPSGSADMVKFPAIDAILIPTVGLWSGYAEQRLAVTNPVNVGITSSYTDASRELVIRVQVDIINALSTETRLTVALTESGIIATQLMPDGSENEDYEHEHMLRQTLTNFSGEKLDATLEPGRVFVKEYKTILPPDWNVDNMDVVAYVHAFGASFETYQAGTVSLK